MNNNAATALGRMLGNQQSERPRRQARALAALAASTRKLAESIIFTDLPASEVEEIHAYLNDILVRLNSSIRKDASVGYIDDSGRLNQPGSPAIGLLNAVAPPLDINISDQGTAHCTFTLGAAYEGMPGLVHGGILALVMDQILVTAAMQHGTPVTSSMELRYIHPAPCFVPLTAEATTVGVEGRCSIVKARIARPDKRTAVRARGSFALPADLMAPD